MSISENYRWPKKGDRLLRESNDWERAAEFAQESMARHVLIWNGFMTAAEELIDAAESGRREPFYVIYPILFNYRHAVELAMKWIISRYGRHTNLQVDEITHHNLWDLWKICRDIIIEIGGEDDAVSVVELIIKDLHDIDKTSMNFRYALNKKGTLNKLPEGMIDLSNIREVMQGVSHFFDGADGQLNETISAIP